MHSMTGVCGTCCVNTVSNSSQANNVNAYSFLPTWLHRSKMKGARRADDQTRSAAGLPLFSYPGSF
jgi:hypothetical protein